MFADDLKLYMEIKTNEDHVVLQRILIKLEQWCQNNKLYMNVKKLKAMSISNKKRISVFPYTFANNQIEKVSEHKDLGVVFDQKLSFKNHIDFVSNNAMQSLGCIKRFARGFTLQSKKNLFFSLVLSKIEYACQIWSPYYAGQMKMIESIQGNFSIWALELQRDPITFKYPSYDIRLEVLNMKKVSRRHTESAILCMYDLLTRNLDAPIIYNKIVFNQNPRNLRQTDLIQIDTYFSRFATMQPLIRMSRAFNKISNYLQLTNSRASFKSKIKLIAA